MSPAANAGSNRIELYADRVSGVQGQDFPHTHTANGVDASSFSGIWDLSAFQSSFSIVISSLSPLVMEFDLIGLHASVANAFRRLLIAEVPAMAVERVYLHCNTSIMAGEVLAQRIGMIPIKADPRVFQFKMGADDPATDLNTIVFKMDAECHLDPQTGKTVGGSVYSGSMVYQPQGTQCDWPEGSVGLVHDDILLCKLRPGQRIEAELHCQKGVGKEHAKWSPVATASYRLLPEITLLSPILGEEAEELASCFPKSVITLHPRSPSDPTVEARVSNPRKDTVSREVLRHPRLADKVRLSRVRDHFLFSIESTGILQPHILFMESVDLLIAKCRLVQEAMKKKGWVDVAAASGNDDSMSQ